MAAYDSIEGGKHLRSFSTTLFYKLAGGKGYKFDKLSAALELIHCASLIVDDEVDKRDVRPDRNAPSVRGKYSPEEAFGISLLDVMYATHLLFEGTDHLVDQKKKLARDIFLRLVTQGEVGEVEKWKFTQKRKIPAKEEYWDKLLGPTAALFFQMTGEIAAIAANADDKTVKKTGAIAYKIGELLQVGDDLKDLKEDMRDGFYSLPIIDYYESLSGKQRNEFENKLKFRLSEKEINNIYYKVVYSDSMEKTIAEIKQKGDEILALLREFPNSNEKEHIISMVVYLQNRMQVTT